MDAIVEYCWSSQRFSAAMEFTASAVELHLFCTEMLISTQLNSLRPLWTGSSLVQLKACHRFGTKPLPEAMLTYCQLDPLKNRMLLCNFNQHWLILFPENVFENVCKILVVLFRHQCITNCKLTWIFYPWIECCMWTSLCFLMFCQFVYNPMYSTWCSVKFIPNCVIEWYLQHIIKKDTTVMH